MPFMLFLPCLLCCQKRKREKKEGAWVSVAQAKYAFSQGGSIPLHLLTSSQKPPRRKEEKKRKNARKCMPCSKRDFAHQSLQSRTRTQGQSRRCRLIPFVLRRSTQHALTARHAWSSPSHSKPHQIITHGKASSTHTLDITVFCASACTTGISNAVVAVEASR
jgi:hypothetical protein